MKCPNCGRDLPGNTSFCTFCGVSFLNPAPRSERSAPQNLQPMEKASRRKTILAIALAAAVVILAVVLILLIVWKKDKPDDKGTTSTGTGSQTVAAQTSEPDAFQRSASAQSTTTAAAARNAADPPEMTAAMQPAAPVYPYTDIELQNMLHRRDIADHPDYTYLVGEYDGYTYYSSFKTVYRKNDRSGAIETIYENEKKSNGIFCQIVNSKVYVLEETGNATTITDKYSSTYQINAFNIVRFDLNGDNREIILADFGCNNFYAPRFLVLNEKLYAGCSEKTGEHCLYEVDLKTKQVQSFTDPGIQKVVANGNDILFANDRYILFNNITETSSDIIYKYLVYDRVNDTSTTVVDSAPMLEIDPDLDPEAPFSEEAIRFVYKDGRERIFSLTDGSVTER